MPRTSPRDRVDAAFRSGGAAPFAETYLSLVLERWRDVQASARRAGTLMVVLAAAFLVVASSNGDAGFDLGPLKLEHSAIVLVWLPAAISFIGLEMLTLQMGFWRYQRLVEALLAKLHPDVVETELWRALGPSTIPLWGLPAWERMRDGEADWLTSLRVLLSALLGTFLLVAWLVLVGAAYAWLDRHTSVDGRAFGAAIALTTFNVLRAGLLVWDERRAGAFD